MIISDCPISISPIHFSGLKCAHFPQKSAGILLLFDALLFVVEVLQEPGRIFEDCGEIGDFMGELLFLISMSIEMGGVT